MKMGNLYTGRIYNYRRIKEYHPNMIQICVMRWPPKYISLKNNSIIHMSSLSPSVELLSWLKEEKTKEELSPIVLWQEFLKRFVRQFRLDGIALENRFSIRRKLVAGIDVILLCHEKSDEDCHRKALPYLILTEEEEECYLGEITFDDGMIQKQLDW